MGAREKQSQSSNWAFVLKKFRDNCGMDVTKLDSPEGILALARTQVTLARIDQPTRDIADDNKPATGEPKKFKPTVLVPTKATFPWEKGSGKSTTAKATPANTPATNATATSAPASNGSGPLDLSTIIQEVVQAAGGSVEFKSLGKLILEKLPDVDRTERTALIKQAKDEKVIAALAEENAWTFDGKELIL